MKFVLVMMKKEFTEMFYSRKSILLVIAVFIFFVYIGSQILSTSTVDDFYLLAIMISWAPIQFSLDSILSDKRNQTLEIMLVSGKIGFVFMVKLITVLLSALVPFIIMFIFFIVNGYNILPSLLFYFVTPLLFWLGGCSAMMIIIFFNDEKSAAFFSLISMFFIIGLTKIVFYLNYIYSGIASIAFLVSLTALFTLATKFVFKHTKIFLKNM